jgi:hypothetical protein
MKFENFMSRTKYSWTSQKAMHFPSQKIFFKIIAFLHVIQFVLTNESPKN